MRTETQDEEREEVASDAEETEEPDEQRLEEQAARSERETRRDERHAAARGDRLSGVRRSLLDGDALVAWLFATFFNCVAQFDDHMGREALVAEHVCKGREIRGKIREICGPHVEKKMDWEIIMKGKPLSQTDRRALYLYSDNKYAAVESIVYEREPIAYLKI